MTTFSPAECQLFTLQITTDSQWANRIYPMTLLYEEFSWWRPTPHSFPPLPHPPRLVVVILTNEIEWSVNPGIARNASGKVFVRHNLWAIFSLSQHRCANHSWFTSDLIRLILLTSSLVLLQCLSWQTFQLPAVDERTVSWRQVLSEFLLPVMKFK